MIKPPSTSTISGCGIPEKLRSFYNPNKTSSYNMRHNMKTLLSAIKIDNKTVFPVRQPSSVGLRSQVKSNGFVSVTIAIRNEHAA